MEAFKSDVPKKIKAFSQRKPLQEDAHKVHQSEAMDLASNYH